MEAKKENVKKQTRKKGEKEANYVSLVTDESLLLNYSSTHAVCSWWITAR